LLGQWGYVATFTSVMDDVAGLWTASQHLWTFGVNVNGIVGGIVLAVGNAVNMLVERRSTPQVDQYLLGLGVEDLPGVGWSMKQQLHQMGIHTVADVRQRSCPSLQKDVGEKKGLKLWEAAHGKDDRCD
jgi:hypothetical protein